MLCRFEPEGWSNERESTMANMSFSAKAGKCTAMDKGNLRAARKRQEAFYNKRSNATAYGVKMSRCRCCFELSTTRARVRFGISKRSAYFPASKKHCAAPRVSAKQRDSMSPECGGQQRPQKRIQNRLGHPLAHRRIIASRHVICER